MRAIGITRRMARRLLLRRAELLVETSVVFYHIARLAACWANFPVAAALRSAPLSQVMQYNTVFLIFVVTLTSLVMPSFR